MKAIVGALALLATGVTIGILIAPEKGKKTRQKIGDKLGDMKDSWKKFRGATIDELDELKSTFKHEISGLQDDTRQKVLELIKTAKAAKNNIKEEASLS
ncbi:MAG: YtxH domain-containing protein [Bacteroidetes bacterium]|nr:YtxH domain-containing protein [Bacteroidota bacterium]